MRMYNKKKFCMFCVLKENYIKVILFLVLVLFIVISVSIVKSNEDNIQYLDDNWSITYNDKELVRVNLAKLELNMTKKGDIITLERKISEDEILFDKDVLLGIRIEVPHCHVSVYCDNEKIYEDHEKGIFYTSLPRDYLNKNIQIKYLVTRDKAFSSLESIGIFDQNKHAQYIIKKNYFEIVVSSAVFIMGLIVIILYICIKKRGVYFYRIFLTGFLFICIGGWILSNSESYGLILGVNFYQVGLRCYTIYFGTPAVGLWLYTFIKDKKSRRIMHFLSVLSAFMAVIFTIINIIDNSRRTTFLMFIEIMALIIILVGRSLIYADYSKISKVEKKLLIAIVVFSIALVLEIVRYVILYLKGGYYEIGITILVGLILFVVLILRAYTNYGYEYVKEKFYDGFGSNTDKITRDVLTGLYDRQTIINKLRENDRVQYSMIKFSLVEMKKINDIYGYEKGNTYIYLFANELKNSLKNDFAYIGRVSGDEFLAITEAYISQRHIERLVAKIDKRIRKRYKGEFEIGKIFTYGNCSSKRGRVIKMKNAYHIVEEKMENNRKRQGMC